MSLLHAVFCQVSLQISSFSLQKWARNSTGPTSAFPDAGIFVHMLKIGIPFVCAGLELAIICEQFLCLFDGGWHMCDPECMLANTLEIFLGIKGRICHMVDFFIRFQIVLKIFNNGSEGFFVGFVPGKCLKKEGILCWFEAIPRTNRFRSQRPTLGGS